MKIPEKLVNEIKLEVVFATLMLVSTSLGMLKVIGLALFMSPEAFGAYITFFGIITILSILLSFGMIEETITLYPSYAANNNEKHLFLDVKMRLKTMVFRCGCLGIIAAASFYFLGNKNFSMGHSFLLVFGCFSVTYQQIISSIARAIDASKLLPIVTSVRGLIGIIVCFTILFQTKHWELILFAEAIALILFAYISTRYLEKKYQTKSSVSTNNMQKSNTTNRGYKIWVSSLIASAIPYGGRSAILFLSGPKIAGAFGLLMMFSQIGQLLSGSLAQKLGSILLKDVSKKQRASFTLQFGPPLLVVLVAFILTFIILSIGFLLPFSEAIVKKYEISNSVVLLSACHILLSSYLLFQFALMAENSETDLVRINFVAVFIFYMGVIVSSTCDWGIIGYIASSLSADTIQMLLLIIRYKKIRRSASMSNNSN